MLITQFEQNEMLSRSEITHTQMFLSIDETVGVVGFISTRVRCMISFETVNLLMSLFWYCDHNLRETRRHFSSTILNLSVLRN